MGSWACFYREKTFRIYLAVKQKRQGKKKEKKRYRKARANSSQLTGSQLDLNIVVRELEEILERILLDRLFSSQKTKNKNKNSFFRKKKKKKRRAKIHTASLDLTSWS